MCTRVDITVQLWCYTVCDNSEKRKNANIITSLMSFSLFDFGKPDKRFEWWKKIKVYGDQLRICFGARRARFQIYIRNRRDLNNYFSSFRNSCPAWNSVCTIRKPWTASDFRFREIACDHSHAIFIGGGDDLKTTRKTLRSHNIREPRRSRGSRRERVHADAIIRIVALTVCNRSRRFIGWRILKNIKLAPSCAPTPRSGSRA